MSNPLLNPQDDRFARRKLPADGSNPFQERDEAYENAAITPAPDVPREEYQMVYGHRGGFLATLAGVGLAMQLLIVLSFFSLSIMWVGLALAGGFPGLVALVLAAQDIRAMRAGAMNPEGLGLTRSAYWMGLMTTVFTMLIFLGIVLLIVYFLF